MDALTPEQLDALCTKLSLDPATATYDAVTAAIDGLGATGSADTAALQTQLVSANAELERIRGEYQALFEREQAAQKQKAEAEVAAILDLYEVPEKAAPVVRSLLMSDRQAGMDLLESFPKKGEAKPADAKLDPPAPVHDPARGAEPADPEVRAAKVRARADELRRSDPRLTRTQALDRASREVPA